MRNQLVMAGALVALLSVRQDAHGAGGNADWGGRAPHPAVVNPVCGYEPGQVVDLAGTWKFSCNRYTADRGQFFRTKQYESGWEGERTIRVPGAWEPQGVGERVERQLRRSHDGAKHQPLRHCFIGNGWYRRTVEIPAAWKGRRVWLKIGGVGCQGWFWVNDMPVAHVFDYCATRKFEITDLVEPGKSAKIVAEVSNAAPSKHGNHDTWNFWGGITRGIELEATPATFIDDAWGRGDFDAKCADVRVTVCGPARDGWTVRASVTPASGGATAVGTAPVAASGETRVRVPLADFRPWDPEHPNLYRARIELLAPDGSVAHVRTERFGIRKLEVRGRDFYLNGRPFFIRGVGFHEIEPIRGYYPPDRDYNRRRIAQARACGFNAARLHTRCETPEFFDAADELGLMLQPELPYYGDHPVAMQPFDPLGDAEELYLNYRRHPSFAVYSGGNEGSFGPVLGKTFYRTVKDRDPDRLVIEQTTMGAPLWKRSPADEGEKNPPVWRGRKIHKNMLTVADANFAETEDFISVPSKMWKRGSHNPPCPLMGHEYMNLAVKSDSRLEGRYTGIWEAPPNARRAVRGAWLAKFGLDHAAGDRLQDAQHALQALWQKRGVECARTDPHCDGYYFWSIADCTSENEIGWTGKPDLENPACMAQGVFDSFFGEKINGQTPAGFAAFNSPVGVFADFEPADLQVRAGEPVKVRALLAHYGAAPFADARVSWEVADASGARLAGGELKAGRQELGAVRQIAEIAFAAPAVTRPTAAKFTLCVEGHRNSWDCWLFPRRTKRDGRDLAVSGACRAAFEAAFDGVLPPERAAEAKTVVADAGSPEIAAALARGQNAIEIGGTDGLPNVRLGWWFLDGIVGATFDTSDPLLKYLPTSPTLSTLHFRIFKKGRRMPVAGFAAADCAVIAEEGKGCFAHLGSRVDAKGGRHLFAHGLALDKDWPESLAILDGLVDRARTPVTAAEREKAKAHAGGEGAEPKEKDGQKPEKDATQTGGEGRV